MFIGDTTEQANTVSDASSRQIIEVDTELPPKSPTMEVSGETAMLFDLPPTPTDVDPDSPSLCNHQPKSPADETTGFSRGAKRSVAAATKYRLRCQCGSKNCREYLYM